MFKKTFSKLSLQKYLDKLYSKCCKIFKAYLTSRRVNFVLTQLRNYYSWCSWVLLLKSLSHKSSIDLQKQLRQLLCNWIRIWFSWIGIWNLYYVKKETLSQAFSFMFCESLHDDGFWDFLRIVLHIFGRLLLVFLLLNRRFCERDKSYKFDNFKTHKNLFFNEVEFYLIIALHEKCLHLSVFSLNAGKCRHFLRSVVL